MIREYEAKLREYLKGDFMAELLESAIKLRENEDYTGTVGAYEQLAHDRPFPEAIFLRDQMIWEVQRNAAREKSKPTGLAIKTLPTVKESESVIASAPTA